MNSPVNLLDFDGEGLVEWFAAQGEKPFRARQVMRWVHREGCADFAAMTDVAKALRARLAEIACLRAPVPVKDSLSADGTRKWLLDVGSGNAVETVFIPETHRGTLCISSQAGCALDCAFCSTGKQGFNRNLTAAEIIGQLWLANQLLGAARQGGAAPEPGDKDNGRIISNVVRMGMGVALAVSLHAPNDALRDKLVPINQKYPLRELLAACNRYLAAAPRDFVTFEYIMLDGVNDQDAHARELVAIARQVPCKYNLIPFNPFPHSGFRRSPVERIRRFAGILQDAGIVATIRKTRGDDVEAACGQLAGQVQDKTRRTLAIRPVPEVRP